MKVECQIGGELEPHAVLCIRKMTPAIEQAISLLEREGDSPPLTGEREGKTFFLDPETLELVCTEGGEIVCYDRLQNRFSLNRPLYELEKSLGGDFVRISKSSIVNIRQIDHVKPGFYGSMELVTKGGLESCISRSYRKSFKERLGL
ncbi:MAG: LytTR family transcriptional regulator [Oscillospiraceae bacterium]|jgi:DNA-binding LytR/AlgR family response regulator|nr:LytTR family transcriptional regulator [Oscillospiraceae bacterium]